MQADILCTLIPRIYAMNFKEIETKKIYGSTFCHQIKSMLRNINLISSWDSEELSMCHTRESLWYQDRTSNLKTNKLWKMFSNFICPVKKWKLCHQFLMAELLSLLTIICMTDSFMWLEAAIKKVKWWESVKNLTFTS
jgi:hypothetical protein